MNGDGKADVVGFTFGANQDVFVSLSLGSTLATPVRWHDAFGATGQIVGVGDIDGDNRADVAATNRGTGQVTGSISVGAAFSGTNWLWGQGLGSPSDEVRYGDVDGDGRTDVVTFRRN